MDNTSAHILYCRCYIPECDGPEPRYNRDWVKYAVPYEKDAPSLCERYALKDNSSILPIDNETCQSDIFDNRSRLTCNDWVYDDYELTIVNQVSLI